MTACPGPPGRSYCDRPGGAAGVSRLIRDTKPVAPESVSPGPPGSVPPFGPPILKLPLYVDPSVLANERIAFNAGSLTDSLILSVSDYVRVAKPEVLPFAQA